jgi:hypothetical protein
MGVRRQPLRGFPARVWHHAAVVLVACGVITLGDSLPFGYLPLLTALAVYGGAAFIQRKEAAPLGRGLGLSLAACAAAVLLQLIPVSPDVVARLSPASMTAGPPVVDARGEDDGNRRTLSIDPTATGRGLASVAAVGLFFVGMVRTMGAGAAPRVASGLVVLGTLVALVGIIETTTGWRVYGAAGLPLPPDSTPHGPFSNRNHYAGWMLMALAVTLGYLCGLMEQRERPARAGRRTAAAAPRSWTGQMLLVEAAAIAMAIALVQTRSRAGILGLLAAVATMTALRIRYRTSFRTRFLVAGPLIALVVMAVAVTGAQPIASRFAVDSWSTGHGRVAIWRQAAAVARDFPVTGAGFNTYRSIVPFYPSPDFDEPYEAAHNDFLQLAAEGGLLVGLPFMAMVWCFVLEARRRFLEPSGDGVTRWVRIGAVVGLAAIAAQETVDFSLQVPGNTTLFALLAAIAVHRAPAGPAPSRPSWNSGGLPSHAQ